MQFKYPDLLWALLLLLIPIIVHLFQFRKFRNTPFTNVKALQMVVAQSHRERNIKRWLLLAIRLCLLASLVLAFAQPYLANKDAMAKEETIVYLDNSFSMEARNQRGSLLENGVQDLLQSGGPNETLKVFTNNGVLMNGSRVELRDRLLQLDHTDVQLRLDQVLLLASRYFGDDPSTGKKLVLISDFQKRMAPETILETTDVQLYPVQMTPDDFGNASIDSVYCHTTDRGNEEIIALVSCQECDNAVPVSLFDGDRLLGKVSADFDQGHALEVRFPLAGNQPLQGKLSLTDSGLQYDNTFYVNRDQRRKIRVMAIGPAPDGFLKRIFTEDEFEFNSADVGMLDYATIPKQHLVILNEVETISPSLTATLSQFVTDGGSLVVIPPIIPEMTAYNALVAPFMPLSFGTITDSPLEVTEIAFSHPLFQGVFEKEVSSFQFPKVARYYPVKAATSPILSFQNQIPFLTGKDRVYVFTAAIDSNNSDFIDSPLIVPVFYNMGINSLELSGLYHTLGKNSRVDVPVQLPKDNILRLRRAGQEFIPQQQAFPEKVELLFDREAVEAGIYGIYDSETLLGHVAFDYSRKESDLEYLDLGDYGLEEPYRSVADLFKGWQNDRTITALWKWFIILATLLIVLETLVQRLLK